MGNLPVDNIIAVWQFPIIEQRLTKTPEKLIWAPRFTKAETGDGGCHVNRSAVRATRPKELERT
jgi:hypothetical protein